MEIDQLEPKRKLYVELVCWIAGEMAKACAGSLASENPTTLRNRQVTHFHEGSAERMADILWRCGILEPVDPDSGYESKRVFPSTFRFIVSGGQLRDKASSAFDTGPSIDDVLGAFVLRAAGFHRLSIDRAPFVVHEDLATILEMLHHHGYASKRDGLYAWNDAMGPVMVGNFLWTEAGQSKKTLAEATLQRLIRELPEHVRLRVVSFAVRGEFLNAVAALRKSTGWSLAVAAEAVEIMYPGIRGAD